MMPRFSLVARSTPRMEFSEGTPVVEAWPQRNPSIVNPREVSRLPVQLLATPSNFRFWARLGPPGMSGFPPLFGAKRTLISERERSQFMST
jgi:hypothetical protein